MAGYTKIFCIGGLGGYQGADGINPIEMQIWLGEGNRQWLEPHYFDNRLKPLGKLRTIIPRGPFDHDALVDACIAFYPAHFKDCPTLAQVEKTLGDIEVFDFDISEDQVPKLWSQLRKEAQNKFNELHIFWADLQSLAHPEVHAQR